MITGKIHGGKVTHIHKDGDRTLCGRSVLLTGKGDAPLCKTCKRIAGVADVPAVVVPTPITLPAPVNSITPQEHTTWEYALTAEELAATLEKVEKINARCAKRGVPGGLTVEYREVQRKEKNALGIDVEWIEYLTKIAGIAPQFSGWQFIATIEFDQYAGLIVRTYPGVNSIDRTNIRDGWCDHCKTTRYRRETYVMYNLESGEQIQVGSSCIKDFTGWTALPVSFDRLSKDVEEMSEGFGSGGRDYSVKTVLSIAWAVIQEYGFVPTRSFEHKSTVSWVRDVLNPPRGAKLAEFRAELAGIAARADEMVGKGEELITWILSDEFSGQSEYVLNLKSVVRVEMVSSRNYGLLASAPQAWARFLERTLVRKVESGPVSEWQGEIGKPITTTATLEAVRYIHGDYGMTTIYKLRDDAGNLFEWFASSEALGDETGTQWAFTATVKAHKEWKGFKSTQITRTRKVTQLD